MKNFKINALAAAVIGFTTSIVNAATPNTPEAPSATLAPTIVYSGTGITNNLVDNAPTSVKANGHSVIGQNNTLEVVDSLLNYDATTGVASYADNGSSSIFGNQNIVKGYNANAYGDGNDAYGAYTQAFGDGNKLHGESAIGFGISNGIGVKDRIDKGNPGDAKTENLPVNAAAFGYQNMVNADVSLAMGTNNTITSSKNSIAIGDNVSIEGNGEHGRRIAIGSGAKITEKDASAPHSDYTIAIGGEAEASDYGATSLGGEKTKATGRYSTALGSQSGAYGEESVAVGREAKARAEKTIAIGSKANATQGNAIAIGANTTSAIRGVSLGADTQSFQNGVAIGYASKALGLGSTAQGVLAESTGLSSIAQGSYSKSTATGSIAIGEHSNASEGYGIAIGSNAEATHGSSVALGSASQTKVAKSVKSATIKDANGNSITYSGFAGTDATGVVSVGKEGETRQVVNVGAGEVSETSTDAINGSQLYMVAVEVSNNAANITKNTTAITNLDQRVTKNEGDIKAMDKRHSVVEAGDNIVVTNRTGSNGEKIYKVATSKNIKADSFTAGDVVINQNGINAGNKNITNVADGINDNDAVNVSQLNKVKANIVNNNQNIANNTKAINQLNKKVNDVDRKSRAGIAGVAAIASAPSARKDGKSMIAAGVANHRGESAVAIKASRNSDNGHWSTNINGAADTRGQFTVGAGVGYEW